MNQYLIGLLFLSFCLARPCFAGSSSSDPLPEDLTEVGLEQLLSFDIEVTSPAKKKQKLSEVASAVYILTSEDIRRSGVNHVADALRLVPGVNVARVTANQWAISLRGFNQAFANKLLVLIDGRSIFTPLFNGVYWELNEIVLEDIDRIEVIRGPGAAIWGANAVNGVINIITKSAKETLGGLISGGGGTEERFFGTARYGGKIGEDTYYRVYTRYVKRDDFEFEGGAGADDDFEITYTGVRVDSDLSDKDRITFNAVSHYQEEGVSATIPSIFPPFVDNDSFSGIRNQHGVGLTTAWTRTFSEESDLQTNIHYFYEDRGGPILPIFRHTLDFEVQHRFEPIKNHDFIYGFEYRLYRDTANGTFADDLEPSSRTTNRYNAYIHDDITLIEDRLHLVLGSKFEINAHTDFEFMPNARVIFNTGESTSLWASFSRAVSTPSRVVDDVIVPLAAFPTEDGSTALLTMFGDRRVESEELHAYEVGFRSVVEQQLSIDVAAFFNDYDDLGTLEGGAPFFGAVRDQAMPTLIIPLMFDSKQTGEAYGVELALDWVVKSWWRLAASYSYVKIDIHLDDSDDVRKIDATEDDNPQNSFSLRSSFDCPREIEFDSVFRYVDRLPNSKIDSYFELDLRLAWQAAENLELVVVGQNLLNKTHREFAGSLFAPPPIEIQRGIYGKATWTF